MSEFTTAQQRIMDQLAAAENATIVIETTAGHLSTLKALAAKGVIEYEQDDDGITVTVVPTKKGNRPIWPTSEALDVNGQPIGLNEHGQLLAVPYNFVKGCYPLMKGQFSDNQMWFEWRAIECERKANSYLKDAKEWRLKATEKKAGASAQTLLEKIRRKREAMLAKLAEQERELLAQVESQSEDDQDGDEGEVDGVSESGW